MENQEHTILDGENDFFDMLQGEFEVKTNSTPGRNIAIQVTGYEQIDGTTYVNGTDLSTDQEIRACLFEDATQANAKHPRTELTTRGGFTGPANRAVHPGGVMILERAYEFEPGLFRANWTHAGFHDDDKGRWLESYYSIVLRDAPNEQQKPKAYLNIISARRCQLVDTMQQVEEMFAKLLEGNSFGATPFVFTRAIDKKNNRTFLLTPMFYRGNVRDSNNKLGSELEGMDVVIARFKNSADYKKLQDVVNKVGSQKAGDVVIEVMSGMQARLTKNQRGKMFDDSGKIPTITEKGTKPYARRIVETFTPTGPNAQGQNVTQVLYTKGHVVFKESNNTKGVYFPSVYMPVDTRPQLLKLENLPTTHFSPTTSQIITAKDDFEVASDADDTEVELTVDHDLAELASTMNGVTTDSAEAEVKAAAPRGRARSAAGPQV